MSACAVSPGYALGSHVAPLGMVFSEGNAMPPSLAAGAFVGEHGSWNRVPYSGYKVVFVAFRQGQPTGLPVDVLTGFLSPEGHAYGRPVGGRHGQARCVAGGRRCWQCGLARQRQPAEIA